MAPPPYGCLDSSFPILVVDLLTIIMKGLFIILLIFIGIPIIMGLVSSYRAGVLPYQLRRAEARRRTLDLIKQGHIKPTKTHYEAWEDDYMGRS